MVFKGKISPETRAYVRFLRIDKQLRWREIAERCQISCRSAMRIVRSDLPGRKKRNVRSNLPKMGRPAKLDLRTRRKILRALTRLRTKEGTFSVKRLIQVAGLNHINVSTRTVQRCLNQNGYFYLQARKKGLMTQKDMRVRTQFARKMKKDYNTDIWKTGIAFYLDATSFIHKTNPLDQARAPKTRVWRKKTEGLQQGCLAKGNKVGSGGKTVKLLVAITHKFGVVCCKPYKEMNGEFFASFIDDEFEDIYRKARKRNTNLFVQDGDPSQNSSKARAAMRRINAEALKIPARSPDINPIENIFKFAGEKLRQDALEKEITRETFQEFQQRCIDTVKNIPCNYIDKVIESLDKRMTEIIAKRGQRLKY